MLHIFFHIEFLFFFFPDSFFGEAGFPLRQIMQSGSPLILEADLLLWSFAELPALLPSRRCPCSFFGPPPRSEGCERAKRSDLHRARFAPRPRYTSFNTRRLQSRLF